MKALRILRNPVHEVIGLVTYDKLRIEEIIKELEELQNRNCDTCKHIRITQFRDYEKAICANENCNEMFDCDVGSDFYCNKWELK